MYEYNWKTPDVSYTKKVGGGGPRRPREGWLPPSPPPEATPVRETFKLWLFHMWLYLRDEVCDGLVHVIPRVLPKIEKKNFWYKYLLSGNMIRIYFVLRSESGIR